MQEIDKYMDVIWETVTFEFAFKFFVVYFFVIWISLLFWVMKDISIRTKNLFLQLFCVLIILFLTPLWVFIYLLIRPRKTLFEKYYQEIEYNLDIINEIVEERKKTLEKKYWEKTINNDEESLRIPKNKNSKKFKKRANNSKLIYKYSFFVENEKNPEIKPEIINLDDLNTKKELL